MNRDDDRLGPGDGDEADTGDSVFTVLVAANPVPDPHSVSWVEPARVVPLRPVQNGSEPMKTIEQTTEQEHSPRPTRRSWILAAAAAVIALVGLGALLIVTRDDRTDEPVDEPLVTPAVTTPSTSPGLGPDDESAALEAAEAFQTAVLAGDVDAVVAMSNPGSNIEADRRMWEMNAYVNANSDGMTIGECRVLTTNRLYIEAGCETTIADPVWEELGIPPLIAPVRYFPDGAVGWAPYVGLDGGDVDFSVANRAYAEYLREFHATEYEAVCDPTGYEALTVHQDEGLALTAECAALWVPLQDDVAAWVVETGFGT